SETYRRLRRHWHFINALKLYEIHDQNEYGVHVYGGVKDDPSFLMASSLYHPDTVVRSLNHEGGTELPGLKNTYGEWDLRPHPKRIIRVEIETLQVWADILDG